MTRREGFWLERRMKNKRSIMRIRAIVFDARKTNGATRDRNLLSSDTTPYTLYRLQTPEIIR